MVRAGCRLVRGGHNYFFFQTFEFEIRYLFTVWPWAVNGSLYLAGPEFSL